MSDAGAIVKGIVKQANPFYSVPPVLDSAVKTILPYVDMLSAQTTGFVVADDFLSFYVTLLFMVSLILIVLSDRVGWTRNIRYTALSAHLALLSVFRAMVTIGLFFVGRRMANFVGNPKGAAEESQLFLATTTLTFVLQKIIQCFVQVSGGGINTLNYVPGIFNPIVDANSFLQSIFQVVFDYIKLYNDLVFNAMNGALSEGSATVSLSFSSVSGDKSAGTQTIGNIRTLYQLHSAGELGPGASGVGTGPLTYLAEGGLWFYSPLFAGLFAGLIAS